MGKIRIFLQILMAFVTVIFAVNPDTKDKVDLTCPGPVAYYRDLGCTPVYRNTGDNCPERFDCEHLKTRFPNRCYINGHEYRVSQYLIEEDANVCDKFCICRLDESGQNGIAAFECIEEIDCGPKVVAKKGCYIRRDPSTCCKDPIEICPKKLKHIEVCNVNGSYYFDGEYFEVDGEPDLTCVCRPGYKGKNVPPFCIKSNHSPCHHPAFSHVDHFSRNCAPVFTDKSKMTTCYMKMRCQYDEDSFIPKVFPVPMIHDWNKVCLFGTLLMQNGDKLLTLEDCIECICEVPPILTCRYSSKGRCNVTTPYQP